MCEVLRDGGIEEVKSRRGEATATYRCPGLCILGAPLWSLHLTSHPMIVKYYAADTSARRAGTTPVNTSYIMLELQRCIRWFDRRIAVVAFPQQLLASFSTKELRCTTTVSLLNAPQTSTSITNDATSSETFSSMARLASQLDSVARRRLWSNCFSSTA